MYNMYKRVENWNLHLPVCSSNGIPCQFAANYLLSKAPIEFSIANEKLHYYDTLICLDHIDLIRLHKVYANIILILNGFQNPFKEENNWNTPQYVNRLFTTTLFTEIKT